MNTRSTSATAEKVNADTSKLRIKKSIKLSLSFELVFSMLLPPWVVLVLITYRLDFEGDNG